MLIHTLSTNAEPTTMDKNHRPLLTLSHRPQRLFLLLHSQYLPILAVDKRTTVHNVVILCPDNGAGWWLCPPAIRPLRHLFTSVAHDDGCDCRLCSHSYDRFEFSISWYVMLAYVVHNPSLILKYCIHREAVAFVGTVHILICLLFSPDSLCYLPLS